MQIDCIASLRRRTNGFVLPLVLLLLVGVWVLSLSLLSLVSVSKRSSHLRSENLQAELALQAGLQAVKEKLSKGCATDDYLIIQENPDGLRDGSRLHLVRVEQKGDRLRHVYQPLFSCLKKPPTTTELKAPVTQFSDDEVLRVWIHPWLDPVMMDWLPVHDENGRKIARYAYWVEDLEGRLDPTLNSSITLKAMDKTPGHSQWLQLLDHRSSMISPESCLAAAGMTPPLQRWSHEQDALRDGQLIDPWAAFLEEHVVIGLQPYEEQARVPYAEGLSPMVMGQTKRNLNQLLDMAPDKAVSEMASWIDAGLPDFEQRKGGFPDEYVETLAANAIDYADSDSEPLVSRGQYRGIDGQPFLSEVVLHLHYQGLAREGDRWVMKWTLRLFAELWNLGSQPIEGGQAQLSYEVNLRPTAVGEGPSGQPFDEPALLDDETQSTHGLERVDGRYLTPAVPVSLLPDQYRFYEFARVDYTIDCFPQLDLNGEALPDWFDLIELEHEARGISLMWNGREVERLNRIHRDPHGLANFRTDQRRKTAKACIPGLNYGNYGSMVNNPGDPRISHYLRHLPLGENAYPENLSPHRRNIRRRNIYDLDPSALKTRHYGRVMPSQWPDGGHDSIPGDFRVTTSDARFPTDPEWWPHAAVPTPQAAHAPQRISNRGYFRQVTELGRVHDPLMWTPAYPDLRGQDGSGQQDSVELLGLASIWQRPSLPVRRGQWPEVSRDSLPSLNHGGGNSLRIGRPEHERFDHPGMRASQLLDLFHCGQAESGDPHLQQGSTIWVEGRVNLNTASHEVLQCLAFGALQEDEAISKVTNPVHDTSHAFGPMLEPWDSTQDELHQVADAVADGIIQARPFASPSEIAHIRDAQNQALFGSAALHDSSAQLQWSDAAAEELFARVYSRAGVRSRNFRVWLVGQSIKQRGDRDEVLATEKRVMTVFVDPGERNEKGDLVSQHQKVRVLHVRDF